MVAKKRKAPNRKTTPKRRKKPVGKACRRANRVVTHRKNDLKKALAKIKGLKKALHLAEKSANKKKIEVLAAQTRAKTLCSGK